MSGTEPGVGRLGSTMGKVASYPLPTPWPVLASLSAYALAGTDMAIGLRAVWRMVLRACYALSGTDSYVLCSTEPCNFASAMECP
eukprot:3941620-Rhodomonas_salina.5